MSWSEFVCDIRVTNSAAIIVLILLKRFAFPLSLPMPLHGLYEWWVLLVQYTSALVLSYSAGGHFKWAALTQFSKSSMALDGSTGTDPQCHWPGHVELRSSGWSRTTCSLRFFYHLSFIYNSWYHVYSTTGCGRECRIVSACLDNEARATQHEVQSSSRVQWLNCNIIRCAASPWPALVYNLVYYYMRMMYWAWWSADTTKWSAHSAV